MNPFGPPTQVSGTENPYSDAYFGKVEKGNIVKVLDSVSELVSNTAAPEI